MLKKPRQRRKLLLRLTKKHFLSFWKVIIEGNKNIFLGRWESDFKGDITFIIAANKTFIGVRNKFLAFKRKASFIDWI